MANNTKHLKAAAQLAGMAYQANPTDHNKTVWEKAQTELEQAEETELAAADVATSETTTDGQAHQETDPKDATIKKLEGQLLLKDKEIEKLSNKVAILEGAKKSTAPGKGGSKATTTTATKAASKPAAPAAPKAATKPATPVAAPVAPATPTEPAAPAAPATAETATDEAKKNSQPIQPQQ